MEYNVVFHCTCTFCDVQSQQIHNLFNYLTFTYKDNIQNPTFQV